MMGAWHITWNGVAVAILMIAGVSAKIALKYKIARRREREEQAIETTRSSGGASA